MAKICALQARTKSGPRCAAVFRRKKCVRVKRQHHERALRALRAEIVQKMAGKAYLLSASAMAGEAELVATLNAARDDEYDEILDKCVDFHAGLAKEVAAEHFTYGELEENEEDLAKLMRWFDKVKARDSLQAGRRADVDRALGDCARALEEFAAQVYAADADS